MDYRKSIYLLILAFSSINIFSESNNRFLGYWLTSASIVHIKDCEQNLCATIEHIFVDEGIDPKSILDENNRDKSLRNRPLVGVNLLDQFKFVNEDLTELKGGKIYDPGRGRIFKSNLYLLDNGNLKVEGCLLRVCGNEEWKPMDVIINEEDGTRSAVLRE